MIDAPLRSRNAQLTRFVLVGAGNTLTSLVVYSALVLVGVQYVAAVVVSYCAALAQGYLLNRRWTFRARGPHVAMAGRYVVAQAAGLLVNLGVVAALVEGAGSPKILAEAAALPAIVVVTFTLNRRWTFRHR